MNLLDDFNGDGHVDLSIGMTFHLGDGTGVFGDPIAFPVVGRSTAWDMVAGDYDADGILDTAAVTVFGAEVVLFFGRRGGDIPPPSSRTDRR